MLKLQFPDINLREMFTTDLKQVDWKRTALLVLLILAVFAALWQWAMPRVKVITQNQFHPVPVIKETVRIKRVLVPCPAQGLVTLDKKEVAERLDLPWLQGSDFATARTGDSVGYQSPVPGNPVDLQVTATADIPENRNGVDVISVTNTSTGETSLVAKEKPSPWFQFRNDRALGMRYGVDQRLQYTGNVYGRWDFLRIKDVYVSANGTMSTGGDASVQFGAEYRW